LINVIFLFI
jgi:dynein heavy chain